MDGRVRLEDNKGALAALAGFTRITSMAKRDRQRVRYELDATGVTELSGGEIAAILRAADTMIGRGGRTQLSKVLKGSREKTILEHGLDLCPAYGFYRYVPIEEVLRRVDWMIENEYLAIVYSARLPVVAFTERGWAIEAETMAEELVGRFETWLAKGPPYDFTELKDRDRKMIFLLLDKLAASGRPELIPLLREWAEIDYAKVRARIAAVIRTLTGPPW
jgi:hypothetical protein